MSDDDRDGTKKKKKKKKKGTKGKRKDKKRKTKKTDTKDKKTKETDKKDKKVKGKKQTMWWDDPKNIKLMNKKVTGRPSWSEKPVSYKRGKIYFSRKKGAFRVYVRKTDRVESTVKWKSSSSDAKKNAFNYGCGLIETDPR